MAKILFITPYPYQQAPSQRFRFEQYEKLLQEQDHELYFASFYDHKSWKIIYDHGKVLKKSLAIAKAIIKRMRLMFLLKKYDYIFIHREVAPLGPPFFEFVIAKVLKRKYIYDFDDAIWLPNYSNANAKFQGLKAYWKVNYAMKWAHRITAGNEYLTNYAQQFNANVQLIPTTIDTKNHHFIKTNHEEEKTIIGWTGSHSTIRYLDMIFPVIKELEKTEDFVFRVISDQAPTFSLDSLDFVKWNKETEIEDLSKIHIGLMPLVEDQWSEGKCGFKALQYMALGMVAVVSPVGVNKTIVQHGVNGYLANSAEEWKEIILKLLKNPQKRKEIGKNGRQRVVEAYSVESQKDKYLALFTSEED